MGLLKAVRILCPYVQWHCTLLQAWQLLMTHRNAFCDVNKYCTQNQLIFRDLPQCYCIKYETCLKITDMIAKRTLFYVDRKWPCYLASLFNEAYYVKTGNIYFNTY